MKALQTLLAPSLCVLILATPLMGIRSRADALSDYHQTCDYVIGANATGDTSFGSCTQAQLAANVYKIEKADQIIFGAATVVASLMIPVEQIIGPWSAVAKTTCLTLDLASAGKVILDQQQVKKAGSEVIGGYTNAVNTAVMAGVSGAAGLALKGMIFDGKSFADVMNSVNTVSKSGKTQTGCIMSAIGLGVLTSAAIIGTNASKKALVGATDTARGQVKDSQTTASYHPDGAGRPGQNPNTNPKNPNNNPATESNCDTTSGTAFAKCVGAHSPEVSALVNNPSAMDTMSKALGGKNLGDFAKNYKGDSPQDAANYIAAGLGVSPSSVSAILDANKKVAKDLGIEAYKPGTFTAANNNAGKGHAGTDPMEQMLADMMKKMADPGEDGLGKDRDPNKEMVFNQLELLPPDKIAERKDISLFDRAHYRMQKNVQNLEQMNWSLRDPASH